MASSPFNRTRLHSENNVESRALEEKWKRGGQGGGVRYWRRITLFFSRRPPITRYASV